MDNDVGLFDRPMEKLGKVCSMIFMSIGVLSLMFFGVILAMAVMQFLQVMLVLMMSQMLPM